MEGMGLTTGRAMRTDRYRFIEWSGKTGDVVCELYDHATDPTEATNLANLPEHKGMVGELRNQLHAGWKGALPAARE